MILTSSRWSQARSIGFPAFEVALRAAGLDVAEERVAAGFARLVVSDGAERTGVDLAADTAVPG